MKKGKKMKVTWIPLEGPMRTEEVDELSLERMREFVGGLIDVVHCPSFGDLVINDAGKLHGLLPNATASIMAWADSRIRPIHDYIAGNVILVFPRLP